MALFRIEHSKLAYGLDFASYAVAVPALTVLLVMTGTRESWMSLVGYSIGGMMGWTLIEYVLHRFVLHGLQPFRDWHATHHERPTALICAPTILSAILITTLVFIPALLLTEKWRACALTLGVLAGYLAYTVTHHLTHHWRGDNAWLLRRKRWHAVHHHVNPPICFGVTTAFWDCMFNSSRVHARPSRRRE